MSDSFLDSFEAAHRAAQKKFNEGDFEAALAGLAPDVEWHLLRILPETGLVRGREAVIRYFRDVADTVEWNVEAQGFTDLGGGRVLVHQLGTGTGKTTGISGPMEFFQIWQIDDRGRGARIDEFENREDALKAAGVSE